MLSFSPVWAHFSTPQYFSNPGFPPCTTFIFSSSPRRGKKMTPALLESSQVSNLQSHIQALGVRLGLALLLQGVGSTWWCLICGMSPQSGDNTCRPGILWFPPARAGCWCCISCVGCVQPTEAELMLFHKPASPKLTLVPAWTFNLSLGTQAMAIVDGIWD